MPVHPNLGREHTPLLTEKGKHGKTKRLVLKQDRENWDEETPEEKAKNEELFAENMNRGSSLLFQDTLILGLQLLQLFCVAESLGQRWQWPYRWIRHTYYILLVNLDVWDFLKVSSGQFEDIQFRHVPSADMPCAYWTILLGWGVLVVGGLVVYLALYGYIQHRHDVRMLSQLAKVQWVYLVLLQCLALPFGVATARVFHCNDEGKVDIENSLTCWTRHHWAYIVPILLLWAHYYVVLLVWLMYRTQQELLSMPPRRHEAYLQLKEIEFVHGLDADWMLAHFHLFSSFRKWGAYFRSCAHALCGLVVLLYAALHNQENAQAIVLTCLLFLAFLACCIVRPYRVPVFNFALCVSLFCILCAFVTGAFVSAFTNATVRSVYLMADYMTYTLVVLAVLFVGVGLLAPLLYILIRHNQRACCPCCLEKEKVLKPTGVEYRRRWEPLWPALANSTLHRLSPETRKFVKAILRNRVVTEQILLMPPLFAPAHELSRQIHVVNAYCREAEYLADPLQQTLWDVLDQLIDAHEKVAPRSLFAESVKPSIQKTAREFLEMMPQFSRRLAQREYDFLLVRPVKRRLLLKMYIMGLFLNNRREKAIRERLTVPHLEKVWRNPVVGQDELQDDGYYEDVYPGNGELTSTYRPETAVALDLFSLDDVQLQDDQAVLGAAEEWAREHPLSRSRCSPGEEVGLGDMPAAMLTAPHQYTNLVFTDDLSDTSSVSSARRGKHADSVRYETEPATSFPAEVTGSHVSLQSSHSQVPVSGQEEDGEDLPTEYAV